MHSEMGQGVVCTTVLESGYDVHDRSTNVSHDQEPGMKFTIRCQVMGNLLCFLVLAESIVAAADKPVPTKADVAYVEELNAVPAK